LEAEPLQEAARWLVSYREYWEQSYDQLDELLAELDRQADRPQGSGPGERSTT
jgi:hypothetical protein